MKPTISLATRGWFACLYLCALSCQTTSQGTSSRQLTILDRFPVQYAGTIGPGGNTDFAPKEAEALPLSFAPSKGICAPIHVRLRFVEVQHGAGDFLLAEVPPRSFCTSGIVVAKALLEPRLEELYARRKAQILTAQNLQCRPEQKVSCAVLNQKAYLQHFDLESQAESLVLDPSVGVLQTGWKVSLTLGANPLAHGSSALTIDLTAERADLLHMSTVDSHYPLGHPISIEVPLCLLDSMAAQFALESDQVAVLPPWTTPFDTAVFTILSVEPSPPIDPTPDPTPNGDKGAAPR